MTDRDFEFYSDQKGPRLMKCFKIVETLTAYDVKFAEGALSQQLLLDSSLPSVNVGAGATISAQTSDNSDYDASQSLSKSESMLSEELFSQEPNEQNRIEWPNLAMMSERYQLSDRASAAVANASLKDPGLITDLDKTYVIGKSKLRREKYRNIISEEEAIFYKFIDGIYIDGRKDATLLTEHDAQTGKYHKTELQEHIVVVGEPGACYLTHVFPQDGRGITVANEVYDAIKGTELSHSLNVVGTDGTASITGNKAGFIRCLEEKLGRPLQWAFCLLHCNELPLRHVFLELF